MKRKIYFLTIMLTTSVFFACGGGDDSGGGTPSGGSEYLNVNSLNVAGNQTEVKLAIQASSNCEWVISYSDAWISISPTKGRGSQEVTIGLTENPKTSERTTVITVKNTSGTISRNVTLTQAGNAENLSLSEYSMNFTSSAESKQVSVNSNTHWTITGKTNWMTLNVDAGDEYGQVIITVQENSGDDRSAVLTFTGSGGKSQQLTVIQTGKIQTITGVSAPQVSDVGKHEATVTFSFNMDSMVSTYGVCYSTSSDPTIENSPYLSQIGSSSQGTSTHQLTNLSSATTYYARAYVVINGGTQYSNSISFTTESSWPGSNDNNNPNI